jgi:GNAT superfamily N-acetyltransferase
MKPNYNGELMTPLIRPISPADAGEMEQLYAQSAAYLRALGDTTDFKFNAAIYLRDGFGDNPAFAGLVAVIEPHLAGYLLYTFGYDTDRAIRYLFVIDLLVAEAWRGQGLGARLMAEAATICRQAGGQELVWAVYKNNRPAMEFYRKLGAQELTDLRLMSLSL